MGINGLRKFCIHTKWMIKFNSFFRILKQKLQKLHSGNPIPIRRLNILYNDHQKLLARHEILEEHNKFLQSELTKVQIMLEKSRDKLKQSKKYKKNMKTTNITTDSRKLPVIHINQKRRSAKSIRNFSCRHCKPKIMKKPNLPIPNELLGNMQIQQKYSKTE